MTAACVLARVLAITTLPTETGGFVATAFDTGAGTIEHVAMIHGDLSAGTPVVRVHSECLTGDAFGSLRCDCGDQLRRSFALVAAEPGGVVVYLRGHEGRGIGLGHKLQAYTLQDGGLDTVEANLALGLPVDDRDYAPAAAVLHHLGANPVRLLTNNPEKVAGLERLGIACSQVIPMPATVRVASARYLRTKHIVLGHEGLAPREPAAAECWLAD